MNPTNDPHENEALSRVLKTHWRVAPEKNPRFRADVWARIEARRSEPANWFGWLKQHTFSVGGIALIAVTLSIVGGNQLATAQADRVRDRMMARYAASIDPQQHVKQESLP
jgi:hypothetical protein